MRYMLLLGALLWGRIAPLSAHPLPPTHASVPREPRDTTIDSTRGTDGDRGNAPNTRHGPDTIGSARYNPDIDTSGQHCERSTGKGCVVWGVAGGFGLDTITNRFDDVMGARICIKGTENCDTVRMNGWFILRTVPPLPFVIVIQKAGYVTQEDTIKEYSVNHQGKVYPTLERNLTPDDIQRLRGDTLNRRRFAVFMGSIVQGRIENPVAVGPRPTRAT